MPKMLNFWNCNNGRRVINALAGHEITWRRWRSVCVYDENGQCDVHVIQFSNTNAKTLTVTSAIVRICITSNLSEIKEKWYLTNTLSVRILALRDWKTRWWFIMNQLSWISLQTFLSCAWSASYDHHGPIAPLIATLIKFSAGLCFVQQLMK